MCFNRRNQIRAVFYLAALSIVFECCRLSIAVIAKDSDDSSKDLSKGGVSISDFFSSFYGDVGDSGGFLNDNAELASNQLSSFLEELEIHGKSPDLQDPQKAHSLKNSAVSEKSSNYPKGDHSNSRNEKRRGRPSRRMVLYDLSVRSHFGKQFKETSVRENRSSTNEEDLLSSKEKKYPGDSSSTTSEENDSKPFTENGLGSTQDYVYYNHGIDYPLGTNGIKNGKNLFAQFSYWTYRLCPKDSLIQIHLNPVPVILRHGKIDNDLTSDFYATEVDPDYSSERIQRPQDSSFSENFQFLFQSVHKLGTYLPPSAPDYESQVKIAWGASEINQIINSDQIEYYIDGDTCIYTPDVPDAQFPKLRNRQSKVIYDGKCCKPRQNMMEQFFPHGREEMITSISEPSPCRYVLNACKFCPVEKITEDTTSEMVSELSNPSSLSIDSIDYRNMLQTYLHHSSNDFAREKLKSNTPPEIFPPMPPSQIEANKQLLQTMFTHAFDSYIYNAFPASELHPVSCSPGNFHLVRIPALTLIDTLDTLIIMGNYTEFARSVERLRHLDTKMKLEFQQKQHNKGKEKTREGEEGGLFSVNQNVSVFETTIRVLGGLLSAHQMAVAFMGNRVPTAQVWGTSGDVLLGKDVDTDDSAANVETEKEIKPNCKNEETDDEQSCPWEPPPNLELSSNSEDSDSKQLRECKADLDAPATKPKAKNSTSSVSGDDLSSVSYWVYDGFLLTLAHDIGKRLLYAFDTDTGIPYGTVNLLSGVPPRETTVASLAGAGTLTLEFELLSRLTGDKSFGKSAKLATRALWARRSSELDLFGKHIDVKNGHWKEYLSGVGSNSDSFYEYLIKHYLLFPDDADFWTMFVSVYNGVWENSRLGDWYVDVDMGHGLNGHVRQIFESLMAFYPGMQILLGELAPSATTLNSFFLVREYLGLLPERFNFVHWKTEGGGDVHPLRPELLESCYFLHLATIGLHGSKCGPCSNASSSHTSSWLWAADFALHSINKFSWTPCGFATVKKISPSTTGFLGDEFVNGNINSQLDEAKRNIKLHDEMPSYFLSETIKYLYLTFDSEDNVLHRDSEREWIFTTEAHPIHNVPFTELNIQNNSSSNQKENGALVGDTKGSHLNLQLDRVRSLLKTCLSNPSCLTDKDDEFNSRKDHSKYFEAEQWAKNTLKSIFEDDFQAVEEDISVSKNEAEEMDGNFVGPPLRTTSSVSNDTISHGIFSAEILAENDAHRQFERRGKGAGKRLSKKCPNFHHPDLIWIRALNGDALDYTSTHFSSTSDETFDQQTDSRMLTALSSVCFYGTDYYYDGVFVDKMKTCPAGEDPTEKMNPNPRQSSDSAQQSVRSSSPGSHRYDMGGQLGQFDVSAFTNGEGFVIRHVNSGELVEVSIFYDAIDDRNLAQTSDEVHIVLVVLTVPHLLEPSGPNASTPVKDAISAPLSSRKSSGDNWKSFFLGDGISSDSSKDDPHRRSLHRDTQKRVVIADMNKHSYMCKVSLTRKNLDEGYFFDGVGSLETEILLADFPCSPGLFGKTNMPSLIQNGGANVKRSLKAPPKDDEIGCGPISEGELFNQRHFREEPQHFPNDRDEVVQLVRRGKCNFMHKALSQRIHHGAEAMIVINSDPDELFVMAGEKPQAKNNDNDNNASTLNGLLPVSVLVSKNDGEAMINLLQAEEASGNKIDATVQLIELDDERGDHFPFVKGSQGTLQIFAQNGWAAHAVKQSPSSQSDQSKQNKESGWQLFLMHHKHET